MKSIRVRLASISVLMLAATSAVAQSASYSSITLTPGFHGSDQVLAGRAGGMVDAASHRTPTSGDCRGWIEHTPNHRMTLTGYFPDLRIQVASDVDTVLVVRGPDGVHCDDDSVGINPGAYGSWSAGTYDVFVGTYTYGASASYTITFSEGPGWREPPGTHPPTTTAPFDTRSTTSNFASAAWLPSGVWQSPRLLAGTTGVGADGRMVTDLDGNACAGFASRTPDHILTMGGRRGDDLSVSVDSRRHTALLIHGPEGWRCDAGGRRSNATIEGHFAPGMHRIWVAAFNPGQRHRYELEIAALPEASPPYAHPHRPGPPGHPHLPPPPHRPERPAPVDLVFSGAFESIDVEFVGANHRAVYDECMAFTSASGTSFVDDIRVFGASHRNGPGFWGAETLCAIAAANARPSAGSCPILVEGSIESVPFAFHAMDLNGFRELVRSYTPALVSSGLVDDITINGVHYHNGPSFWSAEALTAMISYSVERAGAPLVARGDIEGTPFVFAGDNTSEIRGQCQSFFRAVDPMMVDDVTVNGSHRHNGPSFWNEAEVCMMVSSLAE